MMGDTTAIPKDAGPAPGGAKPKPVIGLVGMPASGKSSVARMLAEMGARVIDVDHVGHDVLAEPAIRDRVVERFGETILGADGAIDRARLGAIVFAEVERLRELEAILHPPMRKRVAAEVEEHKYQRPVVIDAAVLYRMGLAHLCRVILEVQATAVERLARVAARGWSEEDLRRREAAMGRATDTTVARFLRIRNEGSLETLHESVVEIWKELDDATQERG